MTGHPSRSSDEARRGWGGGACRLSTYQASAAKKNWIESDRLDKFEFDAIFRHRNVTPFRWVPWVDRPISQIYPACFSLSCLHKLGKGSMRGAVY